jgi:crotonobetainyl-CoA:carnitine CoA-transferase CaiB-like acyl-CoA transferase
MSHRPLASRRVIELGTMIAAPFATHILAQLGAEVIKIEPPTGDTTRALVRGGPSGTFIAYNHSKKSIALDLTTQEGAEVFRRLVATADVLLHNLAPSSTRKLGVTAEDVAAINPKLIYCQIRGYAAGPQYDDIASNPVAEAATGVMEANRIDGRPTRLGPSYHDQFAGAYAVIRILSEMLDQAPSTESRRIELGLYETGLHVAGRDLAGVQLKTQLLGHPEREGGGEFANPGYGAYQTNDGRWIYLLMLTDAHWVKAARALGMAEADDPDLAKLRQRRAQRERVENAVKTAMAGFTYDQAIARLREEGVGFTEVLPIERVLEAPQARQPGKLRDLDFRGFHFEVPEFPGNGEVDPNLPPPQLGEHTMEILASLGFDEGQRAELLEEGAVAVADANAFAWAPPKNKVEAAG